MTKTQTKQETTTEKKSTRLFGAWVNVDKNNKKYLSAPLSTEYLKKAIEILETGKDVGGKILMFENTAATSENKEPMYIAQFYINESK